MKRSIRNILLFFIIAILIGASIFYLVWAATTTYDFSSGAGTNKWAYYGQDDYNAIPVDTDRANWAVAGTEFTSYTEIASSDDTRYETSASSDTVRQVVHDFVIDIGEDINDITQIDLHWEGYGTTGDESSANNDLRMYLLKETTSTFELVDSELDASCSSTDCTMTYSITSNFADYIDTSGYLRFLVQKYEANCGTGTCVGYNPDTHSCAATTNWGDNLYECTGDNKKCDSGSCVTFCQGGYGYDENITITDDVVYCDESGRMWTITADVEGSHTTYAWGGYGTDEPTDSCIGVASRPACNYCDGLTYAGYSDWELPSCVSRAQDSNCILYQFGIDTCGSYSSCAPSWDSNGDNSPFYWSSTEHDNNYAWYVSFYDGNVAIIMKSFALASVRCVRGQ